MSAFSATACTVIALPAHLAEKAGAAEVLAAEDDGIGGFWFFATWRRHGDDFVCSKPLRCWTMREEEEAESLARAARKETLVNTVAIIDAADDRNETRRRERRQVVTNWRPRSVSMRQARSAR